MWKNSYAEHKVTVTHTDGSIKRGGGLCTYIKQGLNFEIENGLKICNEYIELSVIRYNLPCTHGIYVFNVYGHPAGDLGNCIDHLQLCIDTIRDREVDIFFGGDLNVDVKRQNTPNYLDL